MKEPGTSTVLKCQSQNLVDEAVTVEAPSICSADSFAHLVLDKVDQCPAYTIILAIHTPAAVQLTIKKNP